MDLTRLSPPAFEDLAGDLLSARHDASFERFGPGADGGVDLRAVLAGADFVVQCKHYAKSGYSKLKSSLEKELPKVKALSPHRYGVATSVSLSPMNVNEIFELFEPFATHKTDILGAEGLQALIRDNPDVERAHPALWMESAAVLEKLLRKETFVVSGWTLQRAKEDAAVFVRPNNWYEIQKMLENAHCCILSGPPGVGKTITANMLLLDHARRGFEVICARNGVDELLPFADRKQPTIFYFDDFLGQTHITESTLGRNEDGVLLQFMKAVRESKNLRFILTTREYILRDAYLTYEALAWADKTGALNRVIVDMGHYSLMAKAKILARHAWRLGYRTAFFSTLLANGRWRSVINHANYNPRLVDLALRVHRVEAQEDIVGLLVATLDNPEMLWKKIWSKDLNENARAITLAGATLPSPATLEDLEEAATPIAARLGATMTPRAFRDALEVLEGTFSRMELDPASRVHLTRLANPSVRDFLNGMLLSERSLRNLVADAAVFPEQIAELARLSARAHEVGHADSASEDNALLEGLRRTMQRTAETINWAPPPRGLGGTRKASPNPARAVARVLSVLAPNAAPAVSSWLQENRDTLLASTHIELVDLAATPCVPTVLAVEFLDIGVGNASHIQQLRGLDAWLKSRGPLPKSLIPSIHEQFTKLCQQEVAFAFEDASSLDEASSALDDIDAVAELLGLPSPTEDGLREAVEERFQEEDDSHMLDEPDYDDSDPPEYTPQDIEAYLERFEPYDD